MVKLEHSELLGLNYQQLALLAQEFGQPAYRGGQLFEALYRQRVSGLGEITTLPRDFRKQLEDRFSLGLPDVEKKFVSVDGTIRYLMALGDRESIEAVWMPEGDSGEIGDTDDDPIPAAEQNLGGSLTSGNADPEVEAIAPATGTDKDSRFDRATICVSSQVGCAVDCQFCMTALLGLRRSLRAGEIVSQIIVVLNDRGVKLKRDRVNVVFMGMGEPFLNYQEFMKAVRLLVEGVGLAESRMTVSTAGIVPRIADFGREAVRPKLAISLNASNDELRDQLMPINRKWNLEKLIAAAREYPLRPRERLTFEYVLLEGVNDLPENALQLASLVSGLRCKVNLIALNPGPGISFRTPAEEHVYEFQQILVNAGIPAFIRRPRGRDIYAACGQLRNVSGQ
jgi:23S rRNA (adenine2503-C2)-methyltransferase